MKTKVLKVKKERKDMLVAEVLKVLNSDGIVILPTDTVYGIMTGVFNRNGQKEIYNLKQRNDRKPLIMLADKVSLLKHFVIFPQKVEKIIEEFWPGQLTLILPTTELGKMLTGGRDDLGVRIPDNKVLLDIIAHYKAPLMSTSANISGKKSAIDAGTAAEYFNDKADIVIDDGVCRFSFESTVIDMVRFPYVVIRKGCLDCKKLLEHI